MSQQRHRRAMELFEACRELGAEERGALLGEHCAGDAELAREVEALIAFDVARPEFLEPPTAARREAAAVPVIPGFSIRRTIGEGGMGIVYEAEQERPRRRVAIKVLAGIAGPTMLRRFERESELLARLDHPGIAKVFETGTATLGAGSRPYLVLELVRGVPITAHAQRARLDLRERLALMAEVCDAVVHSHAQGVIHRDLKPGNVLVDEQGRPRVLDFGVARLSDPDLERTTLHTGTGNVIGTLQYMSPEQASGVPSAVDERTDVYALGVMLYELLTGRLPHDLSAVAMPEALRLIQQVDPEPPSRIVRSLRGDLETIVLKALEKDKQRRYASAGELAEDLRHWLHDEPVRARPASRTYKLRKLASRNRAAVVAAAAIAASLVAATVVSTVQAARAARQRDLAEQRFGDVRSLALSFLFDVHDEIATLAGSTPARERLAATAQSHLERLSGEAVDDLALLAEVAAAYGRLGDVQGNPRRANLGRTGEALASYEKGLELYAKVRAAGGGARGERMAEADLLQRMGAVHSATGRHTDALASYRRSRELLEELAAQAGEDVEIGRRLGGAIALEGSTYQELGDEAQALAAQQKAFALAERLAREHPSEGPFERDLSIACNELALALERAERRAEAEPYVLRGLAIRRELAAARPDDARAKRDVALSLHRLGSLRLAGGEPERALPDFDEALGVLAALAEADPANFRARYDVSVAHDKAASARAELGLADEALAGYAASVGLLESLVQDDPTNRFHEGALASALERLAGAQRATGGRAAAAETYARALAVAEGMLARGEDDARAWTVAALGRANLADLLLAEDAGQPDGDPAARAGEALELCRRALEALEAMAARGIQPTHGHLERAAVEALRAECERRLAP